MYLLFSRIWSANIYVFVEQDMKVRIVNTRYENVRATHVSTGARASITWLVTSVSVRRDIAEQTVRFVNIVQFAPFLVFLVPTIYSAENVCHVN